MITNEVKYYWKPNLETEKIKLFIYADVYVVVYTEA